MCGSICCFFFLFFLLSVHIKIGSICLTSRSVNTTFTYTYIPTHTHCYNICYVLRKLIRPNFVWKWNFPMTICMCQGSRIESGVVRLHRFRYHKHDLNSCSKNRIFERAQERQEVARFHCISWVRFEGDGRISNIDNTVGKWGQTEYI